MDVTDQEKRFLKSLGIKLRQIRLDKGWTLEQAEEKGWSSWRHLQKIEAGKNVTLVSIKRLAKLYDISISDLLKGL